MKDALINSHLMPSHMINFIKFAITLTLAGIIQHWHLSVASMLSWHSRKCSMSVCVCVCACVYKSCFIFVSISFPIFLFGLVFFGWVVIFVFFLFFCCCYLFSSNTYITFVQFFECLTSDV